MILVKNSKHLSGLPFCKRDLGIVVSWFCFLKRRFFRRLKCHFLIVQKFAFSKRVNPWLWSKIPNIFLSLLFCKRDIGFVFWWCYFLKRSFSTIKMSFCYSRKFFIFFFNGVKPWFCLKILNIPRALFSVQETLVLSFHDVVFSIGGLLDDKNVILL